MTIYFYKTTEMNGLNYVKIPLRTNAILNIENNDKYCFLSSILADLHPCNNIHPNRVSIHRQYLNIQGFDFSKGFRCSDVHKFNELNKLSVNIFEIDFYQDQNKWRYILIPVQISKNNLDRVIDLAIYKNHYVLFKKLDVFLGDHNKKFICRRCLCYCYINQNVKLMILLLLELQMNHIFIGKNIFTKIHSILEYMQISKLIMITIILL